MIPPARPGERVGASNNSLILEIASHNLPEPVIIQQPVRSNQAALTSIAKNENTILEEKQSSCETANLDILCM